MMWRKPGAPHSQNTSAYCQAQGGPETLKLKECLQEVLESGKVRAIGISECSLAEAKAVHSVVNISVIEVEWSLLNRENEVSI